MTISRPFALARSFQVFIVAPRLCPSEWEQQKAQARTVRGLKKG